MRALWSDRQTCSRNMSQKVKRLKSAAAPKRFYRTLQKVLSKPLKKALSNPWKGSIELLCWAPTQASVEPLWEGLQNHRQGSIEPFASNPPPFLGYPFKILPKLRAPSSTPTPKTPETQTMVWVFSPQKLRPWSEFLLSPVNAKAGVVWVLVRVFLGPWSEFPPARAETLG